MGRCGCVIHHEIPHCSHHIMLKLVSRESSHCWEKMSIRDATQQSKCCRGFKGRYTSTFSVGFGIALQFYRGIGYRKTPMEYHPFSHTQKRAIGGDSPMFRHIPESYPVGYPMIYIPISPLISYYRTKTI